MHVNVVQPVHSVLKNLRKSEDHLNKFATRRWSLAAKQLKKALDKVMAVAEDDGHMTREAVEHYSTSCTFTVKLSLSLSISLSLLYSATVVVAVRQLYRLIYYCRFHDLLDIQYRAGCKCFRIKNYSLR